MFVNKFYTFVACMPLMLSSGTTYSFGVWSETMKEAYGLDQTHIQVNIHSAARSGQQEVATKRDNAQQA